MIIHKHTSLLRKVFRKIIHFVLWALAIPATYFITALIVTFIPVNSTSPSETTHTIYISTNGVHIDIIIDTTDIIPILKDGLLVYEEYKYIGFGWGDENFYINTPTWDDLTFANAFSALFLDSSTLMHVTRYKRNKSKWVPIQVSTKQLHALNNYINNTFALSEKNSKQILLNKGYYHNDDFYKAKGSYSLFNTCNSWANNALKSSGIKACLWTPFDFGLINLHSENKQND